MLAESIIRSLGETPSSLIRKLYEQIIWKREIPFDISFVGKPIATGGMTEEEIAELVKEGLESAKDRVYTVEEMNKLLGRQ